MERCFVCGETERFTEIDRYKSSMSPWPHIGSIPIDVTLLKCDRCGCKIERKRISRFEKKESNNDERTSDHPGQRTGDTHN